MKLKKRIITLSIMTIFTFPVLLYFNGGISPSLVMQVLGENDTPIVGAYVVYGYTGIESHIVDSDEYRRPGTIVQTDADGNFCIRSSLHMRIPFLQYKLYPEIYAVYDPKTHCVGILPSKVWLERYKPYKQDGLEEFKRLYWWFETKKIDGIDVLIFKDVTDDPAKWYSSIRQLGKAFHYCDVVGYWNGWEASFEQRKELYDYLVHEYKSLRNQYGNKPCGSMAPENMGIETFGDLISYDFELYSNYYEKEVLGQKNMKYR